MDAAAASLIAQADSSVLTRSFLIALLVVAPYGLWQWSRVRRAKRERAAALAAEEAAGHVPPPPPEIPPLEDVIEQITAAGRAESEMVTVEVPTRVTIDGTPVDPAAADVLVRDAMRRSGLAVVAVRTTADGRVLDCRRTT